MKQKQKIRTRSNAFLIQQRILKEHQFLSEEYMLILMYLHKRELDSGISMQKYNKMTMKRAELEFKHRILNLSLSREADEKRNEEEAKRKRNAALEMIKNNK